MKLARKILLLLGAVWLTQVGGTGTAELPTESMDTCVRLYYAIGLDSLVSYRVFRQAYTGYGRIPQRKIDRLALIDFSKPSTEERFFVIDLDSCRLLMSTYVAHGKGSGGNYATSFSNKSGSHKSSLGFYLTESAYNSRRNGYSLLLNGLERGVNDNARSRSLVIHAADYVDQSLTGGGRLGRSFGCPAVPEEDNARVINLLKGGAVLFIYADDGDYLRASRFIN
jgi:hypothetical protein